MKTKTAAARIKEAVADYRARREILGLKRLELWARPEDHAALRELAVKLQAQRRV